MLDKERGLYVAHCDNGPISMVGKMANRHGLIAGATGTGKTVTLQVLAETFSQAGVPCFMADMKGDLSGISQAGTTSKFIEKRMPEFEIENPEFSGCPTRFFDVFGEQGHPMRATISSMGPLLLSRLLDLNETQTGVMNIVFKIADDQGLLLIDLKDLRAMIDFVGRNAADFTTKYGNISTASVGAIQRSLLTLENQGGEKFFGEPEFDVFDLMQCEGGKGVMNVLAADKLMENPKLYSTFLLWLLSDLYSELPEVGDLDLPKLVFFFDEAHMLFDDTSKALVDKIEQVVRLIRSKGVGVYFVTQNPSDIPEVVSGQLGNRVLHALRAYTPKDQKAVKAAAETFRANPEFSTEEAIMNLETGEALVSFLDEKGAPSVVQRAKILFPLSQIGPISDSQREQCIKQSRLYGRYDKAVDNESAFEVLLKRAEEEAKKEEEEKKAKEEAKEKEKEEKEKAKSKKKGKSFGSKVLTAVVTAVTASLAKSVSNTISDSITGGKSTSKKKSSSSTKTAAQKATKSAANAAKRTIRNEITRSILGNLIK